MAASGLLAADGGEVGQVSESHHEGDERLLIGLEAQHQAVLDPVWIGLDAEGTAHQHGFRWPYDRELVRRFSELAALDLVRRHLLGLPLPD